MQVKNKVFPYPVLNNQPELSGYKLEGFELDYEELETENAYILKNTCFKLCDDYITFLICENKNCALFSYKSGNFYIIKHNAKKLHTKLINWQIILTYTTKYVKILAINFLNNLVRGKEF